MLKGCCDAVHLTVTVTAAAFCCPSPSSQILHLPPAPVPTCSEGVPMQHTTHIAIDVALCLTKGDKRGRALRIKQMHHCLGHFVEIGILGLGNVLKCAELI